MANIKSQIKRNRQNEKRRIRNKSVRSELRTRVKAAEAASGTENEVETLRLAIKRIDKAAQKGVSAQEDRSSSEEPSRGPRTRRSAQADSPIRQVLRPRRTSGHTNTT